MDAGFVEGGFCYTIARKIWGATPTFDRVSNRKGQSMQNEFISVVSSRPTLGKIETTPQIGYVLGYVTKTMCIEAGTQAVRYTTSRGYFESLTTGVVWRTPQTTSKVVNLSASAPAPMHGGGGGSLHKHLYFHPQPGSRS